MMERPIWEIVAERFGMYQKMRNADGYNLFAELSAKVLKGLTKEQIIPILKAHGLKADKFFNNDEFWKKIEEKLRQNE